MRLFYSIPKTNFFAVPSIALFSSFYSMNLFINLVYCLLTLTIPHSHTIITVCAVFIREFADLFHKMCGCTIIILAGKIKSTFVSSSFYFVNNIDLAHKVLSVINFMYAFIYSGPIQ